jgi:pimeloyl-ACP methyl ester carboxylesterase
MLVALVILLFAGVVYERIGERRDRARFAQSGRSIDIGGRTLNLFCSGEGGPAVVFETSSHQAGYAWSAIQSKVARFSTACWYDRAGYGWSEPSSRPHTSASVANDLHQLLKAAAIQPPYVLVGQGQAGLHVRVYHALYPNDVAGVVLVDAVDADVLEEPEFTKGPWARHFGSWAPYVHRASCVTLLPMALQFGVSRVLWTFSRPTPTFGLTAAQQARLDVLSDNPTANDGSELCDQEVSRAQVRAAGGLGDRPLIVLASERRMRFAPSRPEEAKAVDAFNNQWIHELQPRLARLSTRSRLVTFDDGRPLAHVADAVRDIVREIRADSITQKPSR